MVRDNKIIVITGASKGLGRDIAIHLSKNKSNLILIARSGDLLQQLRDEIKLLTDNEPLILSGDISNENDVAAMAQIIKLRYGRIDVLVNNAAIAIHKNSETLTNDEMRRQFEINFFGVFYCIKAFLPFLKAGSSGYVLNVGSLVSRISFPDNSIYSATKFALAGFSEGLSFEMKKYNIKVGYFLPGLMNTSFQDDRNDIIAPAFMFLNTGKVAATVGQMILKRKKQVHMYRWMLFLMRIKRFWDY